MRRYLLLLTTLLLLVLGGCHAVTKRAVAPTLYVAGHNAPASSMDQLITTAEKGAPVRAVVTATVSAGGRVTLSGHWPKNASRPAVRVVFQDSASRDYHQISGWLKNVVVALKRRYAITHLQVVAHSLGNIGVLYYLLNNSRDHTLPTMTKYAALGGNFDGEIGVHAGQHKNTWQNGHPSWYSPLYKDEARLASRLATSKLRVLNVYASKTTTSASDGLVLNASSRSLALLLHGRIAHYQEAHFTGLTHGGLRTSAAVAQRVDRFLWP